MARLIGDKILHRHLGNFPDVHSKAIKLISILPITKPSAFVMEVLLPLAIGGCVHISNQKLSMVSSPPRGYNYRFAHTSEEYFFFHVTFKKNYNWASHIAD